MIEVRDAKNPERLLGHIPKHIPGPLRHKDGQTMASFNVGVMPPFPLAPDAYPDCSKLGRFDTHVIRFYVHFRHSPDGWTRTGELHTDAPLGVLLWLREFRLPGESQREAEERAYRTRYRHS